MANLKVLELLEQSQWVIRGTVQKVGSVSTPEVPASRNTSVVRVDEILQGPVEFSDYLGRDITLYTESPKGLAAGSSAVFFTRSWLYGRGLAVIEVGRIRKGDKVSDDIAAAAGAIADRRLGERIAKADLVVVGEVMDTKPGPALERPIESEHVPLWWEAFVRVADVLKGQLEEDTVSVVYPSSRDEMWIEAPKLGPGQAAILILQRDQQEKGWPVLRVPGLTALDPLDYQPVEALDRVRRLIEAGGNR